MTGITGVAQLHVSVSNLEESVRWYRDVLGLKHLFTVPGQPMAFMDAGGVRIYLGIPENERYRSHPLVYYAVPDVAAAYDEVVGRGATALSGPHVVNRDEETGTEIVMAFVADPDGTPVGLTAERPLSS